jgi:hypothetical protein
MSSSNPPGGSEGAVDPLEQLLARYIGPMAKIYIARAGKTAADDADLVDRLAGCIDDQAEREAFVAGAKRVLAGRKKYETVDAPPRTLEPPLQDAPGAAESRAESSARPREPQAEGHPVPRAQSPAAESGVMKSGAIFVSYARDNIAVAQKLVDALREAGLEVWLDLGKLQAGDAWDLKIRRNIEGCSFFVR